MTDERTDAQAAQIAAFMADLQDVLNKHRAELYVRVDGNATAEIELTFNRRPWASDELGTFLCHEMDEKALQWSVEADDGES